MHFVRRTPARALAAIAAVLGSLALSGVQQAAATVVGGRLGTGRATAPALRVYAWSRANGHLYSLSGGASTTWSLDLPPGRYWLFAGLEGAGAPPIYAAYTEYARCQRHPGASACDSHAIAEVEIGARRLTDIDLTDWALTDDSAAAIDAVLGRPPGDPYDAASRAAPKFSEYPARPASAQAPGAREPSGYHEGDREPVASGYAEAPNYAGRQTLVPVSCGTGCSGIAIVDHATGAVRYPPALNPLPEPPACEARAVLQYRRDSRLMIVTSAGARAAAGGTTMRYYTYDGDSGELRLVANLPGPESSGGLHCAPGERAGR